MSHNQRTRSTTLWDELADPDRFADFEALEFEDTSSISPPSSPGAHSISPDLFSGLAGEFLLSDDTIGDSLYVTDDEQLSDEELPLDEEGARRQAMKDPQKVQAVLTFMKKNFPRLSLRRFLDTIFSSNDHLLRTYTGRFLKAEGGEESHNAKSVR